MDCYIWRLSCGRETIAGTDVRAIVATFWMIERPETQYTSKDVYNLEIESRVFKIGD